MKVTAVIIVLIVLGTAAHADPTAEDLFSEGQAAYARADYATAIARWQESYRLSGESGLLFNLAQAERLSGNCAGAIADYKAFLAGDQDPASEQHQIAESFTRELEPTCEKKPGPVTAPKIAPPPHVVEQHVIEQHHGRALKITGLTTGSTGAALLVTGLVLGHHGSSIGDEVTAACQTSCDWSQWKPKDAAGRRDVSIGRTFDAVGIAAILAGATLYYLGNRRDTIVITPTPHEGATISWSGSW